MERDLSLQLAGVTVGAHLSVPSSARGVVLFAHGSGSSRHSPRNRDVASTLARSGFACLLVDLLTGEEEREDRRTRGFRFDVALLAARVGAATDWLGSDPATGHLPIGLFGASTGAAAALCAAAGREVQAIVSRGGRVDLAADALGRVHAPTLLIVGAHDHVVADLNRKAATRLAARHEIAVVPGASHLFEEPGALSAVTSLTVEWFRRFLGAGAPGR